MKLKTIELPKKYKYKEGESRPEYKKYDGWNKLSYSQKTSFDDPLYKGDYFAQKFLGLELPSGIFAEYGNRVGSWWENLSTEGLSEKDLEYLEKLLPRPKTAKYETEIVVDLEPFGLKKTCIQGYIDQEDEPEKNKLIITDCKTGNHKDKPLYYASPEYQQTTLYCYCRDLEGYEILKSQVYLLERKGNGREGHPLRLSGKMKTIETPYSIERAEGFLKQVAKTAIDIS